MSGRHLTLVVVVVGTALGDGTFISPHTPGVYAAVQRSQGRGRAADNGPYEMYLLDAKGQRRGFVGVTGANQEITRLYLSDPSGRQRLQIRVFSDDRRPEVLLFNASGQQVASLGQTTNSSGQNGARKIPELPDPDAKNDATSDIKYLQDQIDELRLAVNKMNR